MLFAGLPKKYCSSVLHPKGKHNKNTFIHSLDHRYGQLKPWLASWIPRCPFLLWDQILQVRKVQEAEENAKVSPRTFLVPSPHSSIVSLFVSLLSSTDEKSSMNLGLEEIHREP